MNIKVFFGVDKLNSTRTADMESVKCTWIGLFDDSERKKLEAGIFLTGFVSITLGLWLNLSIVVTKLGMDRSYRNLANFTTAAFLRRIVPLLGHMFELVQSTTALEPVRCEYLAFLDTFMAVFEVEWLTHVCIERYIVAKYTVNGWRIPKYHHNIFQCLCLFFSSLYSFPPLLGVGRYGYDFACTFCTYDMILPESWQKYFVVIIFILSSIKPAVVMLMMLNWTRILEKKIVCSEDKQENIKFTKNIIVITLFNQLCWFPMALIRGSVVFAQMLKYHPAVPVSAFYIKWAMWIYWVAPAVTAVALFITDRQIRAKMMRLRYEKDVEQLNIKKAI